MATPLVDLTPAVSEFGPAPAADEAVDAEAIQSHHSRIVEVAGWAPSPWRSSLLYTRHLIDLPALLHLLADEPPPRACVRCAAWAG